ncbi:MAG: TIGR00296 family protein, partial [Nitrososphaerota archaeon]
MKNMKLSLEEGKILVKIARKAIIEYLEKGIIISPPEVPEKLLKKMGVFVTLNAIREYGKELRGCIGYPQPIFPLIEATIRSAISAATEDPRFPPVEIDEMDNIVIEVSVLTVPQLIEVDD